jgi:hypothetical protein
MASLAQQYAEALANGDFEKLAALMQGGSKTAQEHLEEGKAAGIVSPRAAQQAAKDAARNKAFDEKYEYDGRGYRVTKGAAIKGDTDGDGFVSNAERGNTPFAEVEAQKATAQAELQFKQGERGLTGDRVDTDSMAYKSGQIDNALAQSKRDEVIAGLKAGASATLSATPDAPMVIRDPQGRAVGYSYQSTGDAKADSLAASQSKIDGVAAKDAVGIADTSSRTGESYLSLLDNQALYDFSMRPERIAKQVAAQRTTREATRPAQANINKGAGALSVEQSLTNPESPLVDLLTNTRGIANQVNPLVNSTTNNAGTFTKGIDGTRTPSNVTFPPVASSTAPPIPATPPPVPRPLRPEDFPQSPNADAEAPGAPPPKPFGQGKFEDTPASKAFQEIWKWLTGPSNLPPGAFDRPGRKTK